MPKIKKLSKKIIIIAVALLLIIGVSAFLFYKNQSDNRKDNAATQPESFINLNPPTEQEKASGDNSKPGIITQEEARNAEPTKTTSGKRSVTPTITYAGQYGSQIEVGGYVNGVFEDGGSCTLTLQKNDKRSTATVAAVKGANSVDCPVMIIPRSSLDTGQWSAAVSYNSSSSEGQSEARMIEVK